MKAKSDKSLVLQLRQHSSYLACAVNNDVGTGDFSLVLGILHVCGQAHVRSHVSPGME